MKLNATTEMMPVSWREFNRLHPVRAARPGRGIPAAVQPARVPAGRDHRLRGGLAAAERRLPGRVRRPAGHPGLSPRAGRGPPDHLPDPAVGARHQPRERGDGGDEGGGGQERRAGQHRRGRPPGQGGGAPRHPGGPDGDLSLDPRRVRGLDPGDLPDRARARRPGLHGRRQHERAGRALPPGRHRRRRLPPEPAQDVLHSARRRRPGHGPDRRGQASRAVPAGPSDRGPGPRAGVRHRARPRRGAARRSCRSPGPTSR